LHLARTPQPAWNTRAGYSQVQKFLNELLMLLRLSVAIPKPLHGLVHYIDTSSAAPMIAHSRLLDPEKRSIAEEDFLIL
jgi:hypothetical protein